MKINARSPYHVVITATNLTSAKLDLYVYTGVQTLDRGAVIYTLSQMAINAVVVFDISELVKDYLETLFPNDYVAQNVWVDYQVTKSISGVSQTPDAFVQLTGFDGYGYYEDGNNPQLTDRLLQTNTTVYKTNDEAYYVPVQQDNLTKIDFVFENGTVTSQIFSPTSNSSDIIRYIRVKFQDYVFEDGELYLFEDGNQFVFNYTDQENEVNKLILYFGAETITVNVVSLNECKHTPYKLTFVNKFGALQDLWFFKRANTTLSTSKETYKANVVNNGTYNIYEHQKRVLTKTGNEIMTLNSGFYPESHNEVFHVLSLR